MFWYQARQNEAEPGQQGRKCIDGFKKYLGGKMVQISDLFYWYNGDVTKETKKTE